MSRIEHNRGSTTSALNNRFVFSHHYLERICQEPDDRSEAAQLIADLRGWASGWNEGSLSSVMTTQVQPTVVSLGFNYREPSQGEDPHLVRLYTSYRQENQVGLCYVAHREDGETDLDSTVKGRHHAAEIIHALKDEELSWGLLTDGERWRLYHADELAPYETFLEIDLGQLLEDRGGTGRGDAAYLLRTLFTASAFETDEDGECALDRHMTASEKEASAIEKHLSKCIEDVLRDLCQGFVERDGRETYTSDERDEVFRNATVLLYRLLFILYAEARDLLPLEVPAYHAASLDALVEQAAQYVKVSGLPDPDGTELWQDLSDLCSWINSGDEDHHIPAYNGDLFDDSDKRYIHDHTIADKYLAPALFSLGAIEHSSKSGYRRIDYRDLSVRHLGSIYEGLLEVKLFIAQEKRVRRSDGKGGYMFPKLSETRLKKGEEDQVIEVGEVYFADSAGERKAMGAYYTPEYIVDYIVQQTVRRGLEERRASLDERLPGWLEEVESAPPGERQRLQKVVDKKLLDFVEQEVLTFRVCDPAMGSGHFLVNAVHTITTFIVETLNLTPWENADIDSDPVKWRRRVAKRCLYGVDLNALAVELAKLSLWLTTVARGKPLNFLDHHLRQGNSLIGARLEDLIAVLDDRRGKEKERLSARQISMFDAYPGFRAPLKEATDLVRKISARTADVAGDVDDQAADYEQVRRDLKPFRHLADLITAQYFGLDIDDHQLHTIAQHLLDSKSSLSEDHRRVLGHAHGIARTRSFFHWDLEFPEVFIDLERTDWKRYGGFDAMGGNPPYVDSETMVKRIPDERQYIGVTFSTASGNWDLYIPFWEQAVTLLNDRGRASLITPNKWISIAYATALREFLAGRVDQIGDFSRIRVFEDASVSTIVASVHKKQVDSLKVQVFAEGPSLVSSQVVPAKLLQTHHEWGAILSEHLAIIQRIRQDSQPLSAICSAEAPFTVSEAYELVELIHELERRRRSSFKFVVTGTIDRYVSLWGRRPTKYLGEQYLRPVVSRSDLLAYSNRRHEQAQSQKIVVAGLARCLESLADLDGEILAGKSTVVIRSFNKKWRPEAVLAILNSSLMTFYVRELFGTLGMGAGLNFSAPMLSRLPVPRIRFTTPSQEQQHLRHESRNLYEHYTTRGNHRDVLTFVEERLVREPTQSDVVHDLLAFLGTRMRGLHQQRQNLVPQADLFRFVDRGVGFASLDGVFVLDEQRQADDPMDLEAVHHDIDGLRLILNDDGTWTLKLQAKFRDPDQGWQDWIKEEDGHMIKRQWVPAYQLPMSQEKARFYRYALSRLREFDNAGSFPGGYTRSTLKKLHLTKVPMMPDVDLSELARLDRELSETRRKIELTDDLIDQIVYVLYGLTEEEIAIVEGKT